MGEEPRRIMMNWRWTVKDHIARNGKRHPGKKNDSIERWRRIRNMDTWIGLVPLIGIDSDYR